MTRERPDPLGAKLHFSPRQASIMSLVATGLTDKQIAVRLGMSEHTVRSHLARVFKDQGIHSRAAAVMNWVTATQTQRRGKDPP